MKNPSVDGLFGSLFKKPKQETNLEKALRLSRELIDKLNENEKRDKERKK